MSGAVRERLLDLVPRFLTEQERFDLIKRLRASFLNLAVVRLTVPASRLEETVIPQVDALVQRSEFDNLPVQVVGKARWLASDDGQALRALIGRIEMEESLVRVAYLHDEFERIRTLLDATEHTKSLSHRIELPQGTIHIIVRPERRGKVARVWSAITDRNDMDDKNKDALVRRTDQGQIVPRRPNLMDASFSSLSDEQAHQLRGKVLEEQIRLDVHEREAEQRTVTSERDMDGFVTRTEQLSRVKGMDVDMQQTFQTASGSTNIHVKRNNNLLLLVALGVMALLLFVLLMIR